MSQYQYQCQYQPLPPIAEDGRTPPFTRILFLAPGQAEEPFNAHLELINVEQAYPYEALSYTWGTDDPSDYIWLQGSPLPIRPNLAAALKWLRLPNQTRRLWIDAICINQSSPEERSRQVQYMRLVYKHASRVIVWLGLKTPGVEQAFTAAERIARIREYTHPCSSSGGALDAAAVRDFTLSMISDLPPSSLEHLNALLDRPYFTRTWCVQEVVASSWAIGKCEDLEISFFDILSCTIVLATWRGEIKQQSPMTLWGFVSIRREPAGGPVSVSRVDGSIGSLLFLLGMSRNLQATDPRDKIFALFGICDEGLQPVLALTQIMGNNDSTFLTVMRRGITRINNFVNDRVPGLDVGRPKALKPDYSRDAVDLYCDVTRFLLRKSPRVLDALDHVQHTGDPGSGPYPSWVPRWFEPSTCMVFSGAFLAGFCDGHFRYFAELHDSPIRGDSVRPRVLSLNGFMYDTVQVTSNVLSSPDTGGIITPILGAWTQLFQLPMTPDPGFRYADGQLVTTAFCRALLAAPLGTLMGMMALNSAPHLGLHIDFGNQENETREDREVKTRLLVDAFISSLPELSKGPAEARALMASGPDALVGFLTGARWYVNNRRVFRTSRGTLGIGPMAMQPGDEVVALFGGRMPFIVRPRNGHHIFVGSCYVVDEGFMWGKATEQIKFGTGGPPVRTFELW